MVEHNLNEGIWIGYHSHNNMQLAYSNAQTLVCVATNRNLIIDSSVYGMGRGAGNLNTELFIDYLNENVGTSYDIKPLLVIIDEILNDFYQCNYWGYSLPNYLSASHNAHPNYAGYLDDKKTLTVEDMNNIFDMMDDQKKASYDKAYIEELYLRYMDVGRVYSEHDAELKSKLLGKKVLLIAPGKSSVDEQKKICDFATKNDVLVISVNFDYKYAMTDLIFLSNLRRFKELDANKRCNCIVTSNIPADKAYLQTKYCDLITNEEAVKDNAGLMAIRFLINYGVEEIYLAGFDGYSHDERENYGDSHMAFITRNAVLDAMNDGMIKVLKQYEKEIKIKFLTEPRYILI
jgi:4-hydroxy 2-oxovalerate aldolase